MSGELNVSAWSPTLRNLPAQFDGAPTLQVSAGKSAVSQLPGAVRRSLRYWMTLKLDASLGAGSVTIVFSQFRELARFQITDEALTYDVYNPRALPSGPKKLLVLIDHLAATGNQLAKVTVCGIGQGSDTTLASFIVPAEVAEMGMTIRAQCNAVDRDIALTINTTDVKQSPVSIPVGYEPLVMVSAGVDSAITAPALLQADRDGVYGAYPFRKGTMHLYTADGKLHPIAPRGLYPDVRDDAVIEGQRKFERSISVQGLQIASEVNRNSVGRNKSLPKMIGTYTAFGTASTGYMQTNNVHVFGPIFDASLSLTNVSAAGSGFANLTEVTDAVVNTVNSGSKARVVSGAVLSGVNLLNRVQEIRNAVVQATDALNAAESISTSVVVGGKSLIAAKALSRSVVLGHGVAPTQLSMDGNVVIGHQAAGNSVADRSVIIGLQAGMGQNGSEAAKDVVVIGTSAAPMAMDRAISIGSGAQAPSREFAQIGDYRTQLSTSRGLHVRADERDVYSNVDPDARLGLDFIAKLQVRSVEWDMRDAYLMELPTPPAPLSAEPQAPTLDPTDPLYQDALVRYEADRTAWIIERDKYNAANRTYSELIERRLRQLRMRNITPDGTRRLDGRALTVLCDDIELTARKLGVQQNIVTSHIDRDGLDVKTRDDTQLLMATIRAVQDLNRKIESDAYVERLAAVMLAKMFPNKGT